MQRGNIIRKNHIHHTLRRVPGADVRGIMLDDQYSSVTIEENVFYDVRGGRGHPVLKFLFTVHLLISMHVFRYSYISKERGSYKYRRWTGQHHT